MPEVIYDPEDYESGIEKLEYPKSEGKSIFIRVFLFFTLFLAVLIDIMGLIATLIDLGTAGIGGWIIRIIFGLFKLIYLGMFWYLSEVYDYRGGRMIGAKALEKIKRDSKIFIWLTRSLGITSVATGFIPILGDIIDIMPIETFNVVFLFFVYPSIVKRTSAETTNDL